jgi:Fe-S-cluster-containing hydrogenase component 2
MKILVDKTKCTGCLLCELTCSAFNAGMIQREASAIRVKLHDLSDSIHEPNLCRQCKKMGCLKAKGKDHDPEEARKFFWEHSERAADCPFGSLFPFDGKVVHCNLCGGDPECVKSCPTGCLRIVTGKNETRKVKRKA